MNAKIVEFTAIGEPRDVLVIAEQIVEVTPAQPILIRMLYAPVNPADGLRIRGKFGFTESLPATLGGEAVGTIEGFHESFQFEEHGFRVGDLCILPMGSTWAQFKAVVADELVVMPSDIDPKQLSMFGINAASSLLLLQSANLKAGDWFIQNAANSAMGKLIITFARRQGLKSINIVRREDVFAELTGLGADVVLLDGADLKERVARATQGAHVKVALDAVAGSASGRLVETLAFGGRLILYGLLSDNTLTLPANRIAFHGISVSGFSRMACMRHIGKEVTAKLFQDLAQWHMEGLFRFDIDSVFPIDNVIAAFEASELPKAGKVLLQF